MAVKRPWALASLLLLLLLVAWDRFAPGDGSREGEASQAKPAEQPGSADRPGAGPVAAGEPAMIQEIRPRRPPAEMVRAFAVRDWTPPPPPPPARTAPPLQFRYLGKKWEDGNWQIFLGIEERTYIVRESDCIDDLYRVESIRPPAMTLTYLPMGIRQVLDIGAP